MPFADREERLEYLREYYAEYRVENEAEIKARQRRWFRNNKQHVAVRRRINRALARCKRGFEALSERDATIARVLVALQSDEPRATEGELKRVAERLPVASKAAFVKALSAGRTRNFWSKILDVDA